MTSKLISSVSVPMVLAAACLAWGCESAGKMSGRVIEGPGNVVTVLDENDPRFKQDGVGGASIVVRRYAGEGQNGAIIGSGVSEPTGEFLIPITNKDAERYEMVVTATTSDKRISRGRIYFPAPGNQVLVIVREVK
ncbi:MAG: hypothetical protein KF691_06445 [Phycisphaeraceae bacterium]|nr:hypothetical protein [Phycisphaeraceae bacterium]